MKRFATMIAVAMLMFALMVTCVPVPAFADASDTGSEMACPQMMGQAAGITKMELHLTETAYTDLDLLEWEEYDNGYVYEVYFDDSDAHEDELWIYSENGERTIYHQTAEDDDMLRGAIFRSDSYEAIYVTYPTLRSAKRIAAGKHTFTFEAGSYSGDGSFGSNTYRDTVVINVVAYSDSDRVSDAKDRNDAYFEIQKLVAEKQSLCGQAQKNELETILADAQTALYDEGNRKKVQEILAALKARIESVKTEGSYMKGLPKVKIIKASAAKKAIHVKWKKLTKKQRKSGVTGIEIWVCPDKNFPSADTQVIKAGKTKASKKIKVTKGAYYVKVRAVKVDGDVTYYTAWSKVKKVKVKR